MEDNEILKGESKAKLELAVYQSPLNFTVTVWLVLSIWLMLPYAWKLVFVINMYRKIK